MNLRRLGREPKEPGQDRSDDRPIKIAFGWNPGVTRKDAIATAKGYINRRFDAPDISYYAVEPFMGGFLYEVHEGGSGKSYLPNIVQSLKPGSGQKFSWVKCGDRVAQVAITDGRPACQLLTPGDSAEIFSGSVPEAVPTARMSLAINKGTGLLIAGATSFGCGVIFLAAVSAFYFVTGMGLGPSRPVALDKLAHRQLDLLRAASPAQYAEALRMQNGKWSVQWSKTITPDHPQTEDSPEVTPPLQAIPGLPAVAPVALPPAPPAEPDHSAQPPAAPESGTEKTDKPAGPAPATPESQQKPGVSSPLPTPMPAPAKPYPFQEKSQ